MPVGAILTALRLTQFPWAIYGVWVLIVGIVALISIMLFYFGFWGGADFKAFVTISIFFPWHPDTIKPLIAVYLPFFPFPFTILFNTLLLSLSVVLYVLVRNIHWKITKQQILFEGFENESILRKILALLVSYKVDKEKLRGQHYLFLAENRPAEGDQNPKHTFKIQTEESLKVSVENLPPEVWVTPQLPLIIFITLGTATALFLGDFLICILTNIRL